MSKLELDIGDQIEAAADDRARGVLIRRLRRALEALRPDAYQNFRKLKAHLLYHSGDSCSNFRPGRAQHRPVPEGGSA
jgi:hypothetical protein